MGSSAPRSAHGFPPFASALRAAFREGYTAQHLRADLLAGLVVGVVALPLAMALAIASGVPPRHGLITAVIGGALVALAGGSRVQVTGPTAAFVVVLAPITAAYGLGGLLLAGILAGALLTLFGLARLGGLIQFVPYPVTTGFTSGIALVIGLLQFKDFLGLDTGPLPTETVEKVAVLAGALPTVDMADFTVGAATLGTLLAFPRLTRRVPPQLPALLVGVVVASLVGGLGDVDTLGTRFGQLPGELPTPVLPWSLPGPDGAPLVVTLGLVRELFPHALAIALLGAIESLLCAVVADGMTGRRHDPDGELLAQGLGNLVVPFFGGIACTGALARTATNVRAGAVSPLAAAFHAGFVLIAMVALAPLLGLLPMASLAAVLLVVAWNMSEIRHFSHILRTAPRSDVAVLLTCFVLTVVFDMVVSVSVGVVLAALLFMRRMAEVSDVRLVGYDDVSPCGAEGVLVYAVGGPLFFGAAQRAMSSVDLVDPTKARRVVLDLSAVPAIDATGLVALESTVDRLRRSGIEVVLAGVRPQPARALERSGLIGRVKVVATAAEGCAA